MLEKILLIGSKRQFLHIYQGSRGAHHVLYKDLPTHIFKIIIHLFIAKLA
jgi:hypothetical protein